MEGQAWTVRVHGLGHQMPVWGAAQEAQLAEDPKNPPSSFKKSAPERIWKHFSNSSVGQKWGRGSTWRECVGRHMQEWVRLDRPHVFSLWNTYLHTGNLAIFYIWTMPLHLDKREVSRFVAQASTIAKSPQETSLPSTLLTDRVKWTDKILVSIDEKYTRNHLVSGASDGWCVCHFCDEKDLFLLCWTGIRLVKNKIG